MQSISMVSGGRSSAYMAVHYPTDRYLFSPVLSNDPNCRIVDNSLRQYCQDKVSWFDWDRWGCRELDLTLLNLRKLEQVLGTEIEWVAAPFTYDQLISQTIGDLAIAFGQSTSRSPMLPNGRRRFCTEALKIYPAAWHIYLSSDGDPAVVHIGYRGDEANRVKNWKCDRTDMTLHCDIKGKFAGKHRHQLLDYRLVTFPLHRHKINRAKVLMYWYQQGWEFPDVSNCDHCFFHLTEEHKKQNNLYPGRSHWWIQWEKRTGSTFGDVPLHQEIYGKTLRESGPLFACMCTD